LSRSRNSTRISADFATSSSTTPTSSTDSECHKVPSLEGSQAATETCSDGKGVKRRQVINVDRINVSPVLRYRLIAAVIQTVKSFSYLSWCWLARDDYHHTPHHHHAQVLVLESMDLGSLQEVCSMYPLAEHSKAIAL
jgi:hypothetical protein